MTKNIYQPNKRVPDKETLQRFKNEFYIDQYGDLRNKIDRGPGHEKDRLAGTIKEKYIKVFINNYSWAIHCIIDYLYHGNWYHDIIDHKNRNTYDNNINNLERSNKKNNSKNLSLNIRNTSGITGLSLNNEKYCILCEFERHNRTWFYYKDKKRKSINNKNIYYWSSFESAWEAAQLFNWLLRKQNGYSVNHLPEIKVDLNRKSINFVNWNSDNINDIPNITNVNDSRFCVKLMDKHNNRKCFYVLYNNNKRKHNIKNKFYWNTKEEAFEVAKMFCYILRKKNGYAV